MWLIWCYVEIMTNYMNDRKKLKTKKEFRIRSKKFFLTYPKVIDLSNIKELFLESIQRTFNLVKKDKIGYLIAKELHQDGTPHIHVYLEFKQQQAIYSRNKLQVKLMNDDGKEIIQEGKYEAAKSRNSVIDYVLKDNNEDYITNICLPIVDGLVYNNPEEHLLAILETKGFEAAAEVLVTEYKELAARKASTVVRNLKAINAILAQLNNVKGIKFRGIEEFSIPKDILS